MCSRLPFCYVSLADILQPVLNISAMVRESGTAYMGYDMTTPAFDKNGTYSSLTLTEEALRVINQKESWYL